MRVARLVVAGLALSVPEARADGTAAAGKDKSLVCAACHITGDPSSDTPRIAGQAALYLAKQLQAFRQGDRSHQMMNAVARQLTDADIDDLSAFWAVQPPGSDDRPSSATDPITRSRMAFPSEFPRGFTLYLSA